MPAIATVNMAQFNRLGQEAGTEEGTGVGSEFWIELMRERSHEQS